jgi:membrane-bound lytic murein transglycosylase D
LEDLQPDRFPISFPLVNPTPPLGGVVVLGVEEPVMKRTIPIATVLIAAACVHPTVPAVQSVPVAQSTAPAPVPPPAAQSPAPQQAGSPTPTASSGPSAAQSASASAPAARPTADSVAVSPADVEKRAVDVFGAVPAAAAPDSAATGPSWDIEVHSYESTDRVERYVRLFAGSARERIAARLDRGTRYEAMIRGKMREGGLPEDMYYLALIESGFDPNAYSRAAAVGMWQFMTSTARDMGMRVDWWVDERRDPFRSTTAAVRFIKGLRDQFGSLYLAAAAYNGGPGRIARGLTRYADDLEGTSGDDLFFALADKSYLRNETREYVPQLIAAALIAKEPEKYGMTLAPQPAVTYDSVRVGPVTALSAVAKAAGAGVEAIRDLNPHILRGVTPPKDSFYVRIPTGSVDSFTVAFSEMPKSARVGLFSVESRKGQSIASIANENGLATRQLALFNPKLRRLKSGNLAAGQTVLVPTPAVAAITANVPDPAIERYGPSASAAVTTHVVKSGETVSGIAKKYGTTSEALMKANGLKRALIFPGQSLVVKGKAASRKTVSKKSTREAHKKTGASEKKAPAKSKKR